MADSKLGDKRSGDADSNIIQPTKWSPGLVIGTIELQLLCDALRHFPSQRPKRWELVAQLVSTGTAKFASTGPDLHLHGGAVRFTPVQQHCRSLSLLLHEHYPALLEYNNTFVTEALFQQPQKDAFKPIVLIPPIETCCGLSVVVRNRPSFPLVYTTQGTLIAACFHLQCRSEKCGKKYYLSHYERHIEGHKQQYYYQSTNVNQHYFQVKNKYTLHVWQCIP